MDESVNNLDENNLDKASAPTVRAAEHESVKWPTIRNGADASSGEAKFRREKQTIGEEARRNQQRDEQQPNERKSQQMRRMKKKRKPQARITNPPTATNGGGGGAAGILPPKRGRRSKPLERRDGGGAQPFRRTREGSERALASGATNPAPWRQGLGARGAGGRCGSGYGGRVHPAAEPLDSAVR